MSSYPIFRHGHTHPRRHVVKGDEFDSLVSKVYTTMDLVLEKSEEWILSLTP